MFDAYIDGQSGTKGTRSKRRIALIVSAALHVVAGLVIVVYSFWKIDRVKPRSLPVSFASAEAPPAAPAGAPPPKGDMQKASAFKAEAKPEATPRRPKRPMSPTSQPDKPDVPPVTDSGTEKDTGTGNQTGQYGRPDGQEGGTDMNGDPNGKVGAPNTGGGGDLVVEDPCLADPSRCTDPCINDPAKCAPKQPKVVAPKKLASYKKSGNENIQPQPEVKLAMQSKGEHQLHAMIKVCLGTDGVPDRVKVLKSSGYPDYDALIVDEIQASWRYRPYLVNEVPTAVCTNIAFRLEM